MLRGLTHLSTSVHHTGNAGDEVGSLLANLGSFVVETPENGAADLRKVWFHSCAQSIYHDTKAIQHDYVLREGKENKEKLEADTRMLRKTRRL